MTNMRILIASLLLLLGTAGAQAYCLAVPENARSAYVVNNLRQTFCLQSELSQSVETKNQLTQLQTTLDSLQRQLQQQKLTSMQNDFLAVPTWP